MICIFSCSVPQTQNKGVSLDNKPITSQPKVAVLPVQVGQLRHQMGWIEAHGEEACLKVTFLAQQDVKHPIA